MLSPQSPPSSCDVALHYDELGFLYRHLWGERLHHGVWDGAEVRTVREATDRLLELAAAPLDLRPREQVIDIGCGYGTDARRLAESSGAHLTGITISPHQAEVAAAAPPPARGQVRIELGDWLAHDFPDHSFDAALALESLDHMPDKPAFFRQLARTLKAGGRAALACWTVAPDLSLLESALLRRVCHDGRLPSLGTLDDYREFARDAGLHVTAYRDLTEAVIPTWHLIGRRALVSLVSDLRFLTAALRHFFIRPSYALAVPNILLAYHTRALQYGILWVEKESGSRETHGQGNPLSNFQINFNIQ